MSAMHSRNQDEEENVRPSSGREPIRVVSSESNRSSGQPRGRTNRGGSRAASRRSAKPSREKKKKEQRFAPAGVPLPTMGWQKLIYQFRCVRGRPDLVPALGKRELEAIEAKQAELDADWQAKQAELDADWQRAMRSYEAKRLDQAIIALSDRVGTQRVCVINTKGASGNTTTVANVASEHGTVTLRDVTAADFNLASGNLGRRLGRDFGQTLALSALIDGHVKIEVPRDFRRPIQPTRYNVRVVSADNIIKTGKKPNADEAVAAMEALYRNCEFLYMDTLNLITDPVALGNVDFSDVIVFTANVGVQESLRQLGTSMETLREQGFTDKVNRSVVVISNIPAGRKATDYFSYLNVVNDDNEVVTRTEEQHKGKIVGIPQDPYIALDKVVDLDEILWDTRKAYKRLVIAILEQNSKFWSDRSKAIVQLGEEDEPQHEQLERPVFKGFKFAPEPAVEYDSDEESSD
jgi:MinD-like ATPase involved in chromosome partitioning or flagellar assembly